MVMPSRFAISGCSLLFLHEPAEVQRVGETAIDIPGIIGGDAFERVALVPRNELGDLAVLDAADADALFVAGIRLIARGGIGDVDDVVLIDEDAARPAELPPFGDEF